jgi:hypothetical protein
MAVGIVRECDDEATVGFQPKAGSDMKDLGLAPYHADATRVLGVGLASACVLSTLGLLSAWAGFFVGAVPILLAASLAHALND